MPKQTFWQTSLWDHLQGGDERLAQVVEYVLHNPVGSGLVERWYDYRCSGASVFGGGGQAPALQDAGGGQAPALQRKLGWSLCLLTVWA